MLKENKRKKKKKEKEKKKKIIAKFVNNSISRLLKLFVQLMHK